VRPVGLVAVKTWLGPADAEALEAEARRRKVSVAEVIRVALQEHFARDAEHRVLPLLQEALAPHVDRLAALAAKTYVAAAAAAWQANWLVDVAKGDPTEVMRAAVARAHVDLRRKGTEVGGATEEEYQAAEERAGLPPA
jgi:hypothetical protein